MSGATPTPSPPPRKKLPLVVAGLVVLGVAGGVLLALRGGPTPGAGAGPAHAGSSLDTEARVNVLALCDAAQAWRDEHGGYLVAGPEPREVPRAGKPVPFPRDEAFLHLGFDPGEEVNFQYEVMLQESPVGEPEVSCLARGDVDGDGLNTVYRVRLDANGMTTPVEVENPGE
ncbi:hypothetical protein LZ198_13210 [Myxococcus sp. K15C18031901]|uniref:hypothetical protein n=1 Tax=Myxococcus dinghuensis TaxID=2906761 RepID=UPI0020A7B98B|nr:hypothetical protein [Myxococcus dinghuensis]MCP3099827.1 hypothetical protein [Myxococcus dinghuensis]